MRAGKGGRGNYGRMTVSAESKKIAEYERRMGIDCRLAKKLVELGVTEFEMRSLATGKVSWFIANVGPKLPEELRKQILEKYN